MPHEIIASLILENNPVGTLTNFELELSTLVLHEATLLDMCHEANMTMPRSVLDNMPTVSWSTREASNTNRVVADLLRIRALQLRQLFIDPSVFYHPGQ